MFVSYKARLKADMHTSFALTMNISVNLRICAGPNAGFYKYVRWNLIWISLRELTIAFRWRLWSSPVTKRRPVPSIAPRS